MKAKEPSHQQKRWNRHWNYRLDAHPGALAIYRAAKGKLTPKEALQYDAVCREAVMMAAMKFSIDERFKSHFEAAQVRVEKMTPRQRAQLAKKLLAS